MTVADPACCGASRDGESPDERAIHGWFDRTGPADDRGARMVGVPGSTVDLVTDRDEGFANSLLPVSVSVALVLLFGVSAAYVLSRYDVPMLVYYCVAGQGYDDTVVVAVGGRRQLTQGQSLYAHITPTDVRLFDSSDETLHQRKLHTGVEMSVGGRSQNAGTSPDR